MKKYFLILCLSCLVLGAEASVKRAPRTLSVEYLVLTEKIGGLSFADDSIPLQRIIRKENPRIIAALLCASLGFFGVHRMYLGTDVRVPVFYTVTIGGGVALWLADLGIILFSKSLEPYMNNSHVFMWKEK